MKKRDIEGPSMTRFSSSAHGWSVLFGVLLSTGFIVLLIHQVDLAKSWAVLARIDFRLTLIPTFITFGTLALRPWRWQEIFPDDHRPSFWCCFRALAIANGANNFLPARAGDLLRCFLITGDHTLTGASVAIATLGLEKIFDGMVLSLLVLPAMLFIMPPEWLTRIGVISLFVFSGAVTAILFLHFASSWVVGAIRSFCRTVRLVSVGDKLVPLIVCYSKGLMVVRSPLRMASLAALTIVIWVADAALTWSLASTLGSSISFPAAILVSAVLGLGLAIPAAPGFIGTYEFFAVAGLNLAGLKPEAALAVALLMHAWSFLATSILGLVGIATENVARAAGEPPFSWTLGSYSWRK